MTLSRRSLMKGLAAAMAAIGTRKLFWPISITRAQSCSAGVLYEGFLLLTEDDAIPACVVPPPYGPPILCGVGSPPPGAQQGYTETFATPEELAAIATFPVYALDPVPSGLSLIDASMIRHPGGAEFQATVAYGTIDPVLGALSLVSIHAQPDYARPYPMRYTAPPWDPTEPVIELTQVTYTQRPGIRTTTLEGFAHYWVSVGENELYSVYDDHSSSVAEAEALIDSLVVV